MHSLLPILLQFAPALAGLVAGGKAEAVVKAGAQIAQEVIGTADPVQVAEKLASDPALAETFRARLEAETARFQAEVADVQDARATNARLVEAGSAIAWGPVIVSVIVCFAYAGSIAGYFLVPEAKDNNVAAILMGGLTAAFTQVLNYWLGSSKGSRDKDTLLAALSTSVRR